jgi:hypothetical protein
MYVKSGQSIHWPSSQFRKYKSIKAAQKLPASNRQAKTEKLIAQINDSRFLEHFLLLQNIGFLP